LKRSERIGRGRARGASGATLIEVLVSLVILGLLLAALVPFAVFAQQNEVRRNEIRIGESLSRSQLEYLKIQPYVWGNETWPPMLGYEEVSVPGAYAVRFYAVPVDPKAGQELGPDGRYDWYIGDQGNTTCECAPCWTYLDDEQVRRACPGNGSETCAADWGIQKITIDVFGWRYRPDPSEGSRMIFETTGYKLAPGRSLEITKYEVSREVGQ